MAQPNSLTEPYFNTLRQALHDAGILTPVLVLDRDRLDSNIARLQADLPAQMGYRIVAKSLPVPALLDRIRAATGTDRVMSFNLPMLRALSASMPDADQLLGKPLSAQACAAYLASPEARPDKVQWLIDSAERLRAYAALNTPLRIAIELDVGLHRGGARPGPELGALLDALAQAPHLRLSGVMGYEPHLAALPRVLGWRARAMRYARRDYQAGLDQIRARLGNAALEGAVLNIAGSPTFRLYRDTTLANEIAMGSALVKPSDFDTPLLADYTPALFIATPLIKGPLQLPLPGFEWLQPLRARLPGSRSLFIHGGHWLADPISPPGLRYSGIYGRSSNQEALRCGAKTQVTAGEFIFLRPHQSEAVMLQFGDIVVVSQGRVVDHWPSFEISA